MKKITVPTFTNRAITISEQSIYTDSLEVIYPESRITDTGVIIRFPVSSADYHCTTMANVSDGTTTNAIVIVITDDTTNRTRGTATSTDRIIDVYIPANKKELWKDTNLESVDKLAVFILNDDGQDVSTAIRGLKSLVKIYGYSAITKACDDWKDIKDKSLAEKFDKEPKEACGGVILRFI